MSLAMNRLKKLRKDKKLTQTDIAKLLHVSRQSVAFYEDQTRNPKPETWKKLADFYGVSVPYLKGYMVCTRCKGYFVPMNDVLRDEIKGCPYCGNPYFEGDK